ncbi:unnamed protein product [Schistocephalus solidus]|uniref:Uncharacterized protein n=1 Tax=Schistocephalus solidus TaxID=70667 RepID=A0A183TIE6_SCHSO|nr:unnamed protein product [Schistocephalus solidus]
MVNGRSPLMRRDALLPLHIGSYANSRTFIKYTAAEHGASVSHTPSNQKADSGGNKRRPSDDFIASTSHLKPQTAPYTAGDLGQAGRGEGGPPPIGSGQPGDDRDSQRTARIHRGLLNDLNEGTRLQTVPPKI